MQYTASYQLFVGEGCPSAPGFASPLPRLPLPVLPLPARAGAAQLILLLFRLSVIHHQLPTVCRKPKYKQAYWILSVCSDIKQYMQCVWLQYY